MVFLLKLTGGIAAEGVPVGFKHTRCADLACQRILAQPALCIKSAPERCEMGLRVGDGCKFGRYAARLFNGCRDARKLVRGFGGFRFQQADASVVCGIAAGDSCPGGDEARSVRIAADSENIFCYLVRRARSDPYAANGRFKLREALAAKKHVEADAHVVRVSFQFGRLG